MHGYYINLGQSIKGDKSGIGQKIKTQIKVFNEEGLNCTEFILSISKSKLLSVLYRIPFCNVFPIWKYYKEFDDADYIYMRRPFVMTFFMRKVLKQIREKNPKIKIIVEIPTYPYDEEYGEYKFKWPIIWNDRYNRVRMQNLIDYYVTLTDDKEIFGLSTIKIENGIDVAGIPPKKYIESPDGTIHLCAVAMFKDWHGYERFLYGIKTYYNNGGDRNLICHFVGEGSELPKYKDIVRKEHLEMHVIFHGFLSGSELEHIYNQSSISLGSFGAYKKGLWLSCDLKSREAMARGIPMVTGCPTDIFTNKDFKYYFEFPNDPTELDIQKIIEFHDKIYLEEKGETVIKNIRNYAFQTVDMKKCMKNVVSYLKS